MTHTLRFTGIVIVLTGFVFVGYSLLGFDIEDDGDRAGILLSLLPVTAGFVVWGLGEILQVLQRIATFSERNANLAGATLASNAAPKS